MFTGIVEEIGSIRGVTKGHKSSSLIISAEKVLSDVNIGDSISVNGVCLTVTEFKKNEFSVDIMHETLSRSSLNNIRVGSKVNLERAMKADGRFGGHIVSGHIDGTGRIVSIKKDDIAFWYKIKTDAKIMRYIVEKGSITIDGISLTVATVERESFSVSIIPHTSKNTILADKVEGDIVNLENDCIGKYVERLLGFEKNVNDKINKEDSGLTREFLQKNGF